MVNHSCCPNSVRVFGCIPTLNGVTDEVMIVHANTNIPKGTEIVWSYIPPTTPYAVRREELLLKYGFTCSCMRCIKEKDGLSLVKAKFINEFSDQSAAAIAISHIETTREVPVELQRYLRVGYASVR